MVYPRRFEIIVKREFLGGQLLRLHASNVRGAGSIPGQGTKIPQAIQYGLNKKIKILNKTKQRFLEGEG